MRLNDKGQCPACLKKPRVYKRKPHPMLFCARCGAEYDPVTYEQRDNFAWHQNISGEWIPLTDDAKRAVAIYRENVGKFA